MLNEIDAALRRYENGTLSRRELLGALAVIAGAPRPVQQVAPVVGTATQLNHATLLVRDVARTQALYQRLFGLPILTRQGKGVNLRAGAGFVGLYPLDEGRPRIDHICLSIDGFDATRALSKLRDQNLDASIRPRGDTAELYMVDPDGIVIQVQDTKYRGGVGPLGDRDPG